LKHKLEFTREVQKQFRKMDSRQGTLLTRWLYQHVDGTDDPRKQGKALQGNHKGLWRYRVGNYRIIVEIKDEQLIVLAVQVGHRKNIYG